MILQRVARVARPEDTVPHAAHGSESEVGALVSLMMPIVMMRHLRIRHPRLHLMSNIQPTAHSRVLLQGLHDAEKAREPERVVIKWQDILGHDLSEEGIEEVLHPVVLIGISGERVFGPMVIGMKVFP